MSFEEEFDKIIRQKSDEAEFPFNEGNWEQARMLIDSDRKQARLLRLKQMTKPAVALVIVTISAVTAFYLLNESDNTDNLSNVSNEIKPNNTIINTSPSTSYTQITVSKINKEVIRIENQQNDLSTQSNRITTANTQPRQTKQDVSKSGISNAETNVDNTNETENVQTGFENAHASLSEGSAEEPIPNQSDLTQVVETEHLQTKATNSEENANEDQSAIASSQEQVSEVTSKAAQSDYLNLITLNPQAIGMPIRELEATTNIQTFDKDYFKLKSKTHFLEAEFGMTYLNGWSTGNGSDGKGFDYYGGLNYGIYFQKKYSISIGLQAYNIAHISDPYYQASHKDYDFGSITVYTVVACNQMYFASLPIRLNYQINSKNAFGLGINLATLVSSQINSESYYYLDNQKVITSASSEKGLFKGISNYNCMLTAHYERNLGSRLGVRAEFVYGLNDLFSNSKESNLFENTVGLRFGIKYKLFDN